MPARKTPPMHLQTERPTAQQVTLSHTLQSAAIEKLRQTGTPFELIPSYLILEDHDVANRAFTSAVLEVIHEAMPYRTLFLLPDNEAMNSVDIPLGTAPKTHQLPSIIGRLRISDNAQASLYNVVHRISQECVDRVCAGVAHVIALNRATPIQVGLIPAHSFGVVRITDDCIDYKFTLAVRAVHRKS